MSMKALLNSGAVRGAACWIGAQYVRFVHVTGRWTTIRGETAERMWDEGRPFILSFWHGRLLMMPYCWRRSEPIHMLVSLHRDGQLIARMSSHLGVSAVDGSSSKGGVKALRTLLKLLNSGACVGLTPDGPRGPRMRAQGGIVSMARLAGVPILPATYSIKRGRILESWDRFLVALPFSRGVIVWGDPLDVPRDADADTLENARHTLETRMNAITEEADRWVGRDPVTPAPEPEPEPSPSEGVRA